MPDDRNGQAVDSIAPPGKAEGAFLAFAAGDALGWPQEMRRSVRGSAGGAAPRVEFRTWTRRSGGRYRPYEEIIDAGAYSDDTQLTLAVARSRTNHGADWWKAFMQVELPLWTIYERGGGGATRRAAQAWAAGRPPWQSAKADVVRRYFDAGGNGVAMRVLPHALLLAGQDDPAVLVHDVVRDGSATHGHPRALVGATLQAYAAWSLLRRKRTLAFGELLDLLIDERRGWGAFPGSGHGGETWFAAANRTADESYERIWDRTVDEVLQLLDVARNGVRAGALADDRAVLDELGCFGRHKGAGTVTAAAAAYLVARHAAQPAQGVIRAAFESGADTDTLAAMTGGLMGCLAGVEWIPGAWLDVQDAGYLRRMAARVAAGPDGVDCSAVPARPDPPRTSRRPREAGPERRKTPVSSATASSSTSSPARRRSRRRPARSCASGSPARWRTSTESPWTTWRRTSGSRPAAGDGGWTWRSSPPGSRTSPSTCSGSWSAAPSRSRTSAAP